MASKDLGVRFTEEKYATKSEVARELGLSIVDDLWEEVIMEYRKNFKRGLGVKSVNGQELYLVVCPTIQDKINSTDFDFIKAYKEFHGLGDSDQAYYKKQCYIDSLKVIAKIHDIEVSDDYLLSIVDGTLRNSNDSSKILVNYFNALKYVEKAYVNPIDDSFLANIYSRLIDVIELVDFYRESDIKNRQNSVIIDRIYSSVPARSIEGMMEKLFDFVESSNLSASAKAIVTYYYFDYVKPFPNYNDELAILFTKAVIAHEAKIGEVAAFINLERLISERLQESSKKCVDVQKTNDVTYFLTFALTFIDNICQRFVDGVVALSASSIKNDFYKSDDEEAHTEEVVQEEVKKEESKEERVTSSEDVISGLAVDFVPSALSEKEAARLEQDILESDPSLSKGQAYFYARHCTMNRCYTISQYKKALGCAYETARTSMEFLAKRGYYRKEQIKNKFVYYSVSRKGK